MKGRGYISLIERVSPRDLRPRIFRIFALFYISDIAFVVNFDTKEAFSLKEERRKYISTRMQC